LSHIQKKKEREKSDMI